MVVGNYGSGKTEVVVNLAIALAQAGRQVSVADLDIVNPYFRCREARQIMEEHRIRVVVPPGAQAHADLPIIVPELAGMFRSRDGGVSLFDVGGDGAGARVLSSFQPMITSRPYELWQVINSKRPFTGTVEGCLEMQRAIEESSRLSVTGLLVNSHLMQDTTVEVVAEGWQLAQEVAAQNGLPIRCVSVISDLADSPQLAKIGAPILRLDRYLLPPWLALKKTAATSAVAEFMPAPRPRPIGLPPTKIGVTSDGTEE
jgi:hypothetical protein